MLLSLSYLAVRRLLRLLTGSGERDDAARVSELKAEVSSLCDSSDGHGCEPSSTNCSAAFSAASKATSDIPTRFHSSAESPHAALRRANSGLPLDELPICQTDSCRPRTLTRGAAQPRIVRDSSQSSQSVSLSGLPWVGDSRHGAARCAAASARDHRDRGNLHDLRHSHASALLKADVHPTVVTERLGHASIGITLDTYSHVMPGMQEEAAEKIDAGPREALASERSYAPHRMVR
jgi:hypothetical protein